jgi:hypothetical protein
MPILSIVEKSGDGFDILKFELYPFWKQFTSNMDINYNLQCAFFAHCLIIFSPPTLKLKPSSHNFPSIGQKTMILNARQIHIKKELTTEVQPAIILLAIEDVTDMMNVAKMLADHTNKFQTDLTLRTHQLEVHIENLEREITLLKTQSTVTK